MMKLSDFKAMAEAPEVYGVAWEKLQECVLEVDHSTSGMLRETYSNFRRTLLEEGIVACDWHAPRARIETSKAAYTLPLARKDELIWQILCLDCHLVSRHQSNIDHALWYFYEYSETGDYASNCESYFVTAGHDIVDECFNVFGGMARRGADDILKKGVWKEAVPRGPEDRSGESGASEWSNRTSWRVGSLRAAYQKFYDDTNTGRAYAMVPGNLRFDSLKYWVDVEPSRDVPSFELQKDIHVLTTRVSMVERLVKVAFAVAALVGLVRWLW